MITSTENITSTPSETASLLRKLFHSAQRSSVSNKKWSLAGCCTKEDYVSTEYEHIDGSRIRCESSGDRSSGFFSDHRFTFIDPKSSETG